MYLILFAKISHFLGRRSITSMTQNSSTYSDFTLCETYQYQEKPPLPIPFSLVYGRSDGYIHQETLTWWQKETSMPLSKTVLDGDHFYLNHHQQIVIQLINQQLVGDNNALNCQAYG